MKQVLFLGCLVLAVSCEQKTPEVFKNMGEGCYYRLISFSDAAGPVPKGSYVHLSANFQTQNDSVFWDSANNLKDLFYVGADSTQKEILQGTISKHSLGDSFCLAMPVRAFMQEVYQTEQLPYFLIEDTVVKVYIKLKDQVDDLNKIPAISSLRNVEFEQIEAYLGGPEAYESKRDAYGFFWLEKPDLAEKTVKEGEQVRILLQGSFLNGRKVDASPISQDFVFGTPDQVVPGINYVISRLGKGQTAKIILPSRLAFGAFGSSNHAVPPYTPLLFEITIENN